MDRPVSTNINSLAVAPSGIRSDADARHPSFINGFIAHLIATQVLDEGAGERAKAAQRETGTRIDTVLIELGLVSDRSLMQALSEYLGLPLARSEQFPQSAIFEDQLPGTYLKRVNMLPISQTESTVTLATSDAFGAEPLAAIAYQLECPVEVYLAHPSELKEAFDHLYALVNEVEAPVDVAGRSPAGSHDDVQRLKDSASEAPIVRLVSRLIAAAVRSRASDIHIEAMENNLRVRFRIDGVLMEHEKFGMDRHASVVSRIKILSGLDISERRLPQDGRMTAVVDGCAINIRVATTPVATGENIVLRILDKPQADLDLHKLGFDVRTQRFLADLLANPNGLLLVTGPTGSGKSTTLYAALHGLNTPDRKIFSVEDPVEVQCAGINQIPVRPELGLDFAAALRSILRQDPDVVMIGEMRDTETAQIGVRAALTGHMVLTTLHTNSAAAAITRLIDLGLEPFLLAATINGIVSQRLVRTLCPACARQTDPDEATGILLRAAGLMVDWQAPRLLKRPVGCAVCFGTGFVGRTCVSETLIVSEQIRSLITERASEYALEQVARAEGMVPLLVSGAHKVLEGVTVAGEILRVARTS